MSARLKSYLSLTKPRVLVGNVITAVAGYLLASRWHIDWGVFVSTLLGTTLVIASACAFNNYFDRDIDALMERTKNRAVASGQIRGRNVIALASGLGALGFLILIFGVSWLVVLIGLVGFVVYVFFYGMLGKRLSVHGTLVGSVSGAMPVLAGYCAARGRIDSGAVIVFLILFFWQLPEFYSISIYRRGEYKAAGVPVMAVVRGVRETKIQILAFAVAFVGATLALAAFGYTGVVYFAAAALLGVYWLNLALQGLATTDDNRWARAMFRSSLVVLLGISLFMAVGPLLP